MDRQGNAYFATAGRYDRDLDTIVGGGLTIISRNETWSVYTAEDGFPEALVTSMAVRSGGEVWLAVTTDGDYEGVASLVVFSSATGQFAVPEEMPGVQPYSSRATDLVIDAAGDLWITWSSRWDDEYQDHVGGVTRYVGLERVLWQSSQPLSLAGSEERIELVDVPASELGVTGQFHLEAELLAPTGQQLAWDQVPFTVYEEGLPALSLEVVPSVVRPGEPVVLQGSARNLNPLPLEEYGVYLIVEGAGVIELYEEQGISAGGTWHYSATTTAPLGEGTYTVLAFDEMSLVTERLEVVAPVLEASLSGPDVVGSEPFDLILALTNPTLLTLDLGVDFHGELIGVTLPPGESRTLVRTYEILADTTFVAAISGDVTEQLSHTVAFGEALEVTFAPSPVYAEGAVAVPYSLANVGQMVLRFGTDATLVRSEGGRILARSFESYLPTGESASGELLFDLLPGEYMLSYVTPLAQGDAAFRVAPLMEVTLSAASGVRHGSVVTVTAMISNTGLAPLEGLVRVEAPFFETEREIALEGGISAEVGLPIDLSTAPEGVHSVAVSLLSSAGQVLASTDVSINAPGANLILTANPAGTVVAAGQDIELLFGVRNSGAAPATAVISVTLGSLVDEAQSLWLAGGEEGMLSFGFSAPEGLSVETIVGEFWFEGVRHDMTLPVAGVAIDVTAELDQPVYAPGDTATLQLTVVNEGALPTPDMYAHVAYAGEVINQPVSLAGGASQLLEFQLVAQEGADPKVFYAIYEKTEEMGVVLNTTYLQVLQPDVTVVLDSHAYVPGDMVQATIVTTATGELGVSGPGISSTIRLPASGFQFTLPLDLQRGTHWLDYALEGGPAHRVLFDVDAPWVRVTEARLAGLPYESGDQVEVDLTIASTEALDIGVRAWVVSPDLMKSVEVATTVSLDAALNNRLSLALPLVTDQAGRFRLVYVLTAPNDPQSIYAAGSESFDVGSVGILGLRTDKESYTTTGEPVVADLTLFAAEATPATISLLVDGNLVATEAVELNGGVEAVSFDIGGPIAAGRHTLSARLEAGGLAHSASVDFAYGTGAADLAVGTPELVPGTGSPRTIRVVVYNRGQEDSVPTSVQVWDGNPGSGGVLLATLQLPVVEAGGSVELEITWDVLGQAGLHTLVLVADPGDVVAEFYEHNNSAQREVLVPGFDLALDISSLLHGVGETVVFTVATTNLSAGPEIITLTTTVEQPVVEYFEDAVIPGGTEVVFTDTRSLVVPAGAQASEVVEWNTAGAAEDEYTVLVHGVDQSGESASTGAVIYLEQTTVPPEVDAGPDTSGDEGGVIPFAGTVTDPDTPQGHDVTWDFGDGTATTGALTATHVYAEDGVYVATLTVTDTTGLTGTDSLVVNVANVAPAVDAGSDLLSDEGAEVVLSGYFTDPGALDTHTIEWQFGDGTMALGTLAPVHVYSEDGVYTATLMVTDDDGGVGVDTLPVAVANVAPAVDAGPDRTADEGSQVSFSGSFTDPGVVDTHVFEWDFGDGAVVSDTLAPSHVYGDDGVYTVTLTVTDDDGATGADTAVVTVMNVEPDVTAYVTPTLALPRQEVTFEGAFTDPGWLDAQAIEWDFGDGITMTGSLTATHAYDLGDVYVVTLTITDDDGGVGQASVEVGVSLELYPIALHADTIAGAEVGQELDDILNGEIRGSFGWLSWTGDQGALTLAESLTPFGNSGNYVNPNDSQDSVISVGDWVYGAPGVLNSTDVRDALEVLQDNTITVPVWDEAERSGGDVRYHVVGFAHVQITGCDLAGDNLVSAIFWGLTTSPEP